MSILYWNIVNLNKKEFQNQNKEESYGKKIVATLWRQLSSEYGTSFSEKNLRRMIQFANSFSIEKSKNRLFQNKEE